MLSNPRMLFTDVFFNFRSKLPHNTKHLTNLFGSLALNHLPALLPELLIVKNAGGLERISLKEIRKLAKAVRFLFKDKNIADLRAALRPIWGRYLASLA
jgi:hypothetical protein